MTVQNDTEVFYAVRVDPRTREQDRTDPRMGTREAIHKRGLQADPVSRSFCPHQWLDADGFVNQELARLHPYSHQLPDGPTGFATAMGATPPLGLNGPDRPHSIGLLDEKPIVQPPMAVPAQALAGDRPRDGGGAILRQDGSPFLREDGALLLREEPDTARIDGHTPHQRTIIVRAVLSNQVHVQIAAAALLSAIELKIEVLRTSGSNSEIDEFDDLKRRVEEFLAANSKRDEAPIADATLSIADGLRRFWTEKHVSICEKTLDMTLFGAGLAFCGIAGVLAVPTALTVGAIVGGKNVVEAIKAGAKLLPERGTPE